ncbi:glycerate kinase [Dyadobacter fermentans]|uniref:Glycerate kinase n=1 Tax=Dyadobacter fermentans (strain ATCC 700827 / DSM 18053 / CIP 107007 / KCTC 52180 / NS114) TaxID=471854 RepID=C6W7N6_DYAFD|nr:glycerate kinase [Dyadobacter fermentans]ACT96230.1 glycerate kinase [Dyadobacter fermentans DSM 18053]
MNILVAPDKFRGSLEAAEVCNAIENGVRKAFPNAKVTSIPLADGGEGTSKILTQQANGSEVTVTALDPLNRPLKATYGISADHHVAFIEMAAASGLGLLKTEERNPLLTSTFGTGQLIVDALDKGVKTIILGIGGSATTDGGIGMAEALGFAFKDKDGHTLLPNGQSLGKIASIDVHNADPRLALVSVVVACDVTNPLFGKDGAAFVYGPQKGADPKMVVELDHGLQNLAQVATRVFGRDVSLVPGAGAAGGLGAGCMWFLNATLKDGISIVMEQCNVASLVEHADLVITGEGKVDEQTLAGKVVKGLAGLCRSHHVPLAVVCGTLQITPEQAKAAGMTYAVSVLNRPMDLNAAQNEAFQLVSDATFQLVRLFFFNRGAV